MITTTEEIELIKDIEIKKTDIIPMMSSDDRPCGFNALYEKGLKLWIEYKDINGTKLINSSYLIRELENGNTIHSPFAQYLYLYWHLRKIALNDGAELKTETNEK